MEKTITLIYEFDGLGFDMTADNFDDYDQDELEWYYEEFIDTDRIMVNRDKEIVLFGHIQNPSPGEVDDFIEQARAVGIPGIYSCPDFCLHNVPFVDVLKVLKYCALEMEEIEAISEKPWVIELSKRIHDRDIIQISQGLYDQGHRGLSPEYLATKHWIQRDARREGKDVLTQAREVYNKWYNHNTLKTIDRDPAS